MTTASSQLSGRRAVDPAPLEVTIVGAEARAILRVQAILRDAGVPANVRAAGPTTAGPADVLVVWSRRGITARNAMIERLRTRLPETRLLVVGPPDSRLSIRAAIEVGADGLVFEGNLDRALPATMLAVVAGQVAVPATHRHSIGKPSFTQRQREIIEMMMLGLANKEIAARLFVTESTVKSHLSAVFVKLGVRSRTEAVAIILESNPKLRMHEAGS